jgi:2-polyprenyl-3-methyl-5-hydroxy-6-metoxy-1,4-benzoquinol methylase
MLGAVVRVVLLLCALSFLQGEDQWLFQSESKWNKEWKSGAWTYMETVAVERSRIAVIGGVFIPMFAGANASVLDIGCGEGSISDFLTENQKHHYVGVDLAKEAIIAAKKARGPPLKFVHSAAHTFTPTHKFDAVVFSDVLYYVEHEKVLRQYEGYLNPNGIVIISIFHQTEKLMYEQIFNFAREHFTKLDEIDVSGYTKKSKDGKLEKTAFHIEVYRIKPK